jgi:hypothetical protein
VHRGAMAAALSILRKERTHPPPPRVGRSWDARPEKLGPNATVSKEMIWAVKVNQAEMKNGIEGPTE